jgi:hypothetical protein
VGARGATKVMIKAPQGSRWNGQTGIVASLTEDGETAMVRIDAPRIGPAIPFGLGELVDVTPRRPRS